MAANLSRREASLSRQDVAGLRLFDDVHGHARSSFVMVELRVLERERLARAVPSRGELLQGLSSLAAGAPVVHESSQAAARHPSQTIEST